MQTSKQHYRTELFICFGLNDILTLIYDEDRWPKSNTLSVTLFKYSCDSWVITSSLNFENDPLLCTSKRTYNLKCFKTHIWLICSRVKPDLQYFSQSNTIWSFMGNFFIKWYCITVFIHWCNYHLTLLITIICDHN